MSIYSDTIDHYGPSLQLIKAGEEMAEFAAELIHYGIDMQLGQKPKNGHDLAEEWADVEIMLKQVEIILYHLKGDKHQEKKRKLDRLHDMITQKQDAVIDIEKLGCGMVGAGDAS
jgi:hypothetical protein